MAKLRNSAEHCKHVLSTLPSAQSSIESLFDGIDFQCSLGRARFEMLCNGLLQQCLKPIDQVLTETGLGKKDIHKVILCGGSAKIPVMQQRITDCFPHAEISSRLAPDEVIAVGAAKQAGILTGNELEEILQNAAESELPCLPAAVMVRLGLDVPQVVFSRHTPIPSRRQKTFTLEVEETSCCLVVLLGTCDSADASGDKTTVLAKIVMTELPPEAEINAVFHLRSDGSLHVTCTESKSKKTEDVIIEGS